MCETMPTAHLSHLGYDCTEGCVRNEGSPWSIYPRADGDLAGLARYSCGPSRSLEIHSCGEPPPIVR
jgi:hypothetical protein